MEGISIVIPTYKRPDLLERLLNSIESQTYKNKEVIVVDDNSPNVEEYHNVIEKFKDKLDIIFISNKENKGAPYSRNTGIRKAKFNLIALVDDDDEWRAEKLEQQVKKFDNKNVGIVYTWTDALNENKEVVYQYKSTFKGMCLKEILKECFIPSPSVMVRKEAILKAGLFDEKFPSCQDWDMWTRIVREGYECDVVEKALTIYNKHNRESIGTSGKAKYGYKMYYRKHFNCILKCYLFTNIKVVINAFLKGYIK